MSPPQDRYGAFEGPDSSGSLVNQPVLDFLFVFVCLHLLNWFRRMFRVCVVKHFPALESNVTPFSKNTFAKTSTPVFTFHLFSCQSWAVGVSRGAPNLFSQVIADFTCWALQGTRGSSPQNVSTLRERHTMNRLHGYKKMNRHMHTHSHT